MLLHEILFKNFNMERKIKNAPSLYKEKQSHIYVLKEPGIGSNTQNETKILVVCQEYLLMQCPLNWRTLGQCTIKVRISVKRQELYVQNREKFERDQ